MRGSRWLGRWHGKLAGYLIPIFAGLLFFVGLASSNAVRAADSTEPPPLCRLGVNGTHSGDPAGVNDGSLTQLRIGWYQGYRTELAPTRPNGAEYAQTIRLEQTGPDSYTFRPNAASILQLVANNAGSMWLIGNEPDRRAYQDDMEPHLSAAASHEL